MGRLDGKVCVITGAGGGMGREAAIVFTDEGAKVCVADLDGARALRVARGLETGNISVNSNSSVRITTPFGGFKQSGVGRELGPFALEHYTELKNVFFAT